MLKADERRVHRLAVTLAPAVFMRKLDLAGFRQTWDV